ATVTVKEDKTKAELKDAEVYVGQKWDVRSVFKCVLDKDGIPLNPEEIKYFWINNIRTKELDTSKPGTHYAYLAINRPSGINDYLYSNTINI
ncbi:hypothetical protein AB3H87_13375, partial [Enterococcus sp. C73]